jgi:hypothetical protein
MINKRNFFIGFKIFRQINFKIIKFLNLKFSENNRGKFQYIFIIYIFNRYMYLLFKLIF